MGRNNLGHIYGPVPSRRFGRSLGIDIIPFKICTYDCIYCQLGRTRKKTLKRNQFYDINSLLRELETFLQNKREIDYLTFSGSGEPTLNTGIGEIIQKLKKISDIPVIVLTNGSLLWDKEVRNSLKYADIVVPSMDAVSEETFLKINRPSDGLKISDVLNGLKNFSFEFKGRIFLEIMFVKGINTSKKELKLMKDIIGKLQIDKVHLNTVVRPPAEKDALPLDKRELEDIKNLLSDDVPVEIIAQFSAKAKKVYNVNIEKEVVELLKRRPCRLEEMADSLGINRNELLKYITQLQNRNVIKLIQSKEDSEKYYIIN